MLHKTHTAASTAVLATQLMPRKKPTLRDSLDSALVETSKLSKIFHGTHWLRPLKPPRVNQPRRSTVFLTMLVMTPYPTCALLVSAAALMMKVVLDLDKSRTMNDAFSD
jgi:hypothetical protein